MKHIKDATETHLKRIIQSGRSMIEMLGVLAIIGVITIGGFWGYRYAMYLYQANTIFADVNRFAFSIMEREDHLPNGLIDKSDFVKESRFEITAENEKAEQRFHIDVSGIVKPLCKIILEKGETEYILFAGAEFYEGDTTICKDENIMRFYFGKTDKICNLCVNKDDEGCCGDCMCSPIQECKENIRKDEEAYANEVNASSKICCPKGKVNCNGYCVDDDCGGRDDLELNASTCLCTCKDPMKKLDKDYKCVCKGDSFGNKMKVDKKTGNCVCEEGVYSGTPEDGMCCKSASWTYVPSMKSCKELKCPNGENGRCTLDGYSCGVFCHNVGSAKTVKCNNKCRPDECEDSRDFERMKLILNKNGGYKTQNGGYYWGCRKGNGDCWDFGGHGIGCFNADSQFTNQCCQANSEGKCVTGSCDTSICNQFKSSRGSVTTGDGRTIQLMSDSKVTYVATGSAQLYGGCRFSNGVECWPTNEKATTWTCRTPYNKDTCAAHCDMNEEDCWRTATCCAGAGTDCKNANCGGKGEPETDSNGNSYCCFDYGSVTESGAFEKSKRICVRGESEYRDHYFKENGKYSKCGWACSYTYYTYKDVEGNTVTDYTKITSISCSNGYCQDPKCPAGWTYAETTSGGWGCIIKCDYGWEITEDGRSCRCNKPGFVIGKDGKCTCRTGWILSEDGETCTKTDETAVDDNSDNTWLYCVPTWSAEGFACYETISNGTLAKVCGGDCQIKEADGTVHDRDNSHCKTWYRRACAPAVTQDDETRPACVYNQRLIHDDEEETASLYKCWCKGNLFESNGEKYCCTSGQIFQGGSCVVCPASMVPNIKENKCCAEGETYDSVSGKCVEKSNE